MRREGFAHEALDRVFVALGVSGSVIQELPVDRPVVAAMLSIDRDTVPNLSDRIIAATARLYGLPVISRDRQIQLSTVETVW